MHQQWRGWSLSSLSPQALVERLRQQAAACTQAEALELWKGTSSHGGSAAVELGAQSSLPHRHGRHGSLSKGVHHQRHQILCFRERQLWRFRSLRPVHETDSLRDERSCSHWWLTQRQAGKCDNKHARATASHVVLLCSDYAPVVVIHLTGMLIGWGQGLDAYPGKTCLAFLAGLCSLASFEELLASDSAPQSGAEPTSVIMASCVICSAAAHGSLSVFMSAGGPHSGSAGSASTCESLSALLSKAVGVCVGT